MSTNLRKKPVLSNSACCESCDIENRINEIRAQNDLMESVLYRTEYPHVSMTDHIMVALQNPEIYHALNSLFETPLHHYHCYNNAFHHLPFDEMAWHKETPLVDVVRVFSEIKDSLLSAHLSAAKSNS